MPFGSGEEGKNRFSRGQPWWPSWISDKNDFSYSSPRCFLSSFMTSGLWFQEKKQKIDFQDGGHLGFPIGTILAIFYLQVNWPFISREERKNRFSRWWP